MNNLYQYVKLSDICDFINGDRGKNYPSGNDFVKNGIPFINAGHIVDNRINFESMNYITEEKYEVLGSGKIQEGDIIYCLRGSLGKNAVVDINKGAIASSLVILRPKRDVVNSNYLIKYLNSREIQEQINKENNGSSQPNLSAKSVKEFKIFLPDYNLQNKIAKVLIKSQELINIRKEQIESLDELVKSKFIEMFGSPATNPKGFKKVAIKEVIDIKIEKSKKVFDDEDEISYIDISCIDNVSNKIIANNKYNFSEAPSRAQQCINVGDILISTVRPNLKNIAMVQDELENMVTTSGVTVLRSKNINKSFLFRYVLTDYFTEEMVAVTSGANYPAIKSSDIYNHEIINPPIELQNKFANFVNQVDKFKFEMENSLKELDDNFSALMQKAFKGELFS